jgi:hypothetical protein
MLITLILKSVQYMYQLKTLHVFGEILLKRQIEEEVRVGVLYGNDWTSRDDVELPCVGVIGGFEFTLDRDTGSPVSSWPRLEIVVGVSRSSIIVPALNGSYEKAHILRHMDAPWWTLGLYDTLEVTVTMHIIAEC